MNIFEQAKILLSLCPIPQIIQEMIFNILVGYGTPISNILTNLEEIKKKFAKKIYVYSFGRSGCLSVCHTRKTLNYYQMLTLNENATYFTLKTIYEIHEIYLQRTDTMRDYNRLTLFHLNQELSNITRTRLLKILKEEKKIKNKK